MNNMTMINLDFIRFICKTFNFIIVTTYGYFMYNRIDFFEDLFLRLSQFNIVMVKILQCSSNNNDIWSKETKEIINKYTDHVPYTLNEIDFATCYELEEKGIKINAWNPIHSGTIAIVYEAQYKDKNVIVKVKRNNIQQIMEQSDKDIMNIVFISKWIPFLNRLQIEENYHIYSPLLFMQCDFEEEIKNQQQYSHNFKNNENVKIPHIYHELCTKNAIVMEYIEGINIANIKEEDKEPYMSILGDIMMTSIVVHGFFHCDAHSGNLKFLKNGDKHIICALDYGICGKYDINEIDLYYNIFTEIGRMDYKEATLLFLKGFSDYKESDIYSHDGIVQEVSNLLLYAFETKKEFSFGEIFKLYTILNKYNIRTNKSWLKTELGIAAIDGCMKLLKTENITLTDILKHRINALRALENSIMFE